MRSGCSLPSTVLLLLLLGLGTWGIRHWQPSFVCNTPILNWFCGGGVSDIARKIPIADPAKAPQKKQAEATMATGVAHPFPWPVAEKPTKWTNFRKGAYDVPSVAKTAAVAAAVTGVAHPFPWPVADKPVKWTNFREGAYSISSVATKAATLATGVAHPFPWPVADKPVKWTNFRDGAYSIAAAPEPKSKTVAHPFPWPIAEKPVKWTNVRKAPKQKKIVAKKPRHKTQPHPFPWPIAEKPVKWTNFREGAYSIAAAPEPKSKTVAHPFPWPIADKPRKWTNFRKPATAAEPAPAAFTSPAVPYADNYVGYDPAPPRNGLALLTYRVKKSAPRQASDCGAELNRVAQAGTILFETASARLTESSYDTLDQLVGVAKTCDRVSITVEGHTDDRGSASFNQGLSERRAQSVAAYLQGAGIPGDSLKAVGYGESRPAVPNTTAANLAKNRRIEFSVSGN